MIGMARLKGNDQPAVYSALIRLLTTAQSTTTASTAAANGTIVPWK